MLSWPLPLKVRHLQLPSGHAYLGRLFLEKVCCISTQHALLEAHRPSSLLARLDTGSEVGAGLEDAIAAGRRNQLTLCHSLLQCTRCRPLGSGSVQRQPRW